MSASDRTEQPTQHRLEEARRKGQVARSRHLGEVAGLLAALATLSWYGGHVIEGLEEELARSFARLGTPQHVVNAGEVTGIAIEGARALALYVGPMAVAAAVAVVGTNVLQAGWILSFEPLQVNFGKLSPANGFKRFGLARGGMETLKAILVVAALAWIARGFVWSVLEEAPRLARLSPADAALVGWAAMRGMLWRSSILLGVVAGADYLYQKRQYINSLKMTKQEVKDDLKMTEGSPETKGRVRRVMRDMFRRRMMAAVPKATVVITNPTHYAVALEYRRQTMAAPVIVAMGKDLVAQRIKALAREHGVPLVENVGLAQALYRTCDIGDTVPPHLFEAVAEVLAYLIRLKQLVL
jgi:flagellar biosynthetic protein FlhB